MNRTRLLAVSALAISLLLSACGAGAAPAFTVGDEDFSNDQLNQEIDAMLERPSFFAAVFGFCPTIADPTDTSTVCPEVSLHADGTYPQAVAAFAIRQRIFFSQVKQELAAQGISPTSQDREFVNEALTQVGEDGRSVLDLLSTSDQVADEAFIGALIDDFASQVALQNLFPGEEAFNAFIADANATVEVNSRYGSWNSELQSLEPPAAAIPLANPVSLGG